MHIRTGTLIVGLVPSPELDERSHNRLAGSDPTLTLSRLPEAARF